MEPQARKASYITGRGGCEGVRPMLRWAVIFLVIALVAAVFGFTDIAAASATIAKVLFGIFLILFLVALVLGFAAAKRVT
jgi:uncharacterized membrane protein YtjA (UPF0391 family)